MRTSRYLFVTALAITLTAVFPGTVVAQDLKLLPGEVLPKLENVQVKVKVTLKPSGIFTYAYSITNPASNTGEIWLVGIDITKPAGGMDLGSEGITNGPRFLSHSSALVLSTIQTPLVPVGLFSPPGWTSGITIRGTAGWGSSDDQSMIQPRESLTGHEMTSRGIPGIRSITLEPFFRQTPVDEATAENTERIKAIEKAIVVTLKTVGPSTPPKDFIPIEFLNYLITLLHDSRRLGWIRVDGVHQSFLAKLTAAKRKLEAGEPGAAGNILHAFLNEVRAVSCPDFSCPGNKPLTSEAYALLFFNGQFFLTASRSPTARRHLLTSR